MWSPGPGDMTKLFFSRAPDNTPRLWACQRQKETVQSAVRSEPCENCRAADCLYSVSIAPTPKRASESAPEALLSWHGRSCRARVLYVSASHGKRSPQAPCWVGLLMLFQPTQSPFQPGQGSCWQEDRRIDAPEGAHDAARLRKPIRSSHPTPNL